MDSRAFYHASFRDFLQDPARAEIFHVGRSHQVDLCRHILKALSYIYDDPSVNRQGHVSRVLRMDAFNHIASSEPTSSLQSRPKPKDLIEVWEDYGFMIYCESGWNLETGIQAAEADWDSSHQALSQASPSLIPILQAVFLLRSPTDAVIPRWVTDAEFLGDQRETVYQDHVNCRLRSHHFPPRFDSILSDLARSSLHPMQRVLTDEIDKRKVWGFEGFSFYLRSCSHSSKLLQDLRVAEPVLMTQGWWHPYDYYNIVQWLKAFPQPPLELISRFEGYYLDWANGSDLEGKWRDWKESVKRHLDMVERCGKRRNRTIVPGHPRKLVP
ncbi:hypothetical protein B0H14DRAFT_2621755 [Mycena olivaceomarginata]|nr:hypothetical protein B0H14DRAFT_2621755 [Mycena olivaceomarginata]